MISKKFWWDDWALLAATFCIIPVYVLQNLATVKGFGRHLWNVPLDEVITVLQLYWVAETIYIVVLTLVKLSILFFYLRIFPRPQFRRTVKATLGFVAIYGLSFIFVIVFQCKPIKARWDLSVEGKCVNINMVAYSAAGISIFQDIIILLIPIPEILGLKMDVKKRINVMLILGIGVL